MKVQRIMMKAQHVKNIDHIRQSWLSIIGAYGSKPCNNKFMCCFHKAKLSVYIVFAMQTYKKLKKETLPGLYCFRNSKNGG